MPQTFQINITGRVQGVGFRPFVHQQACKYNITGTVNNTNLGVHIICNGTKQACLLFYQSIINQPPVSAIIKTHRFNKTATSIHDDFSIIPSPTHTQLNLALTPDFAICETCKQEIKDPKNHRYNYPFTTCVQCGPRFALSSTYPFERAHTSLNNFPMCPSCENEYTSATEHRYHSQTNSCPNCGIEMWITDNQENKLTTENPFVFLAKVLKEGKIIALKNTSGYLLCCSASNIATLQNLRTSKKRPHKPFAVLYPNIASIKESILITDQQQQLLTSSEAPIVLVKHQGNIKNIALEQVAPNLKQLGVMLPYSGILELLCSHFQGPLVATSGNLHGSPILSQISQAHETLHHIVDYFFHHNLNIIHPQDDSVISIDNDNNKIIHRRSRGLAPNYLDFTPTKNTVILALGGHLKSCFAYVPNDYLYISPYIGNLTNFNVCTRLEDTVNKYITLFSMPPEVILSDKHPQYYSTELAQILQKKHNCSYYQIQHHQAHFAAVLGEHQLFQQDTPVLGIIWDGTGYGDDGAIWGGEFFEYNKRKIKRKSHFEYFKWIAGDKMAKEPRLSLLSLLSKEHSHILTGKFTKQELQLLSIAKRNSNIQTSSVGRLFDAVASLLNICDFNSYEGEAAILLENSCNNFNPRDYQPYTEESKLVFSSHKIILAIVTDLERGSKKQDIIARFFVTLATIIINYALQQNYCIIACSGGVFQNIKLRNTLKELAPNHFQIVYNKQLAPNDENIAYGQLMHYTHIQPN